MSCIMAKKKTGLSNSGYVTAFFAVVLVLLLACTKGKEEPSASVPTDCQQFLDKYFGAWKSKDIATLQALSFYLSPAMRSQFPEGSLELWRESKNKLVAENFRPRKDKRCADLISEVLPFGRLLYGGPNAVSNAIGYAQHYRRAHNAVIRVYDAAGNVIETHEHAGDL